MDITSIVKERWGTDNWSIKGSDLLLWNSYSRTMNIEDYDGYGIIQGPLTKQDYG